MAITYISILLAHDLRRLVAVMIKPKVSHTILFSVLLCQNLTLPFVAVKDPYSLFKFLGNHTYLSTIQE